MLTWPFFPPELTPADYLTPLLPLSLPYLFLRTSTTRALSATPSIVHYRLFNQRCCIPRESRISIPIRESDL